MPYDDPTTPQDESVVGVVMKNGGGATVGAVAGVVAANLVGLALAPFTGGLSIPAANALALGGGILGGVVGHKASQTVK